MKAVTNGFSGLRLDSAPWRKPCGKVAVPSGAQVVAERLSALGIVREGNESLAEATAPEMGLSVRELRAELQQRAAGTSAHL
jgi:hypothetical protein